MTRPGRLFQQLPKVVKARRNELRLTQREVGRRAGVSTSTVSRIESGQGGTTFVTIDSVLGVLGLTDWMDTLTAFAEAARPRSRYIVHDQLAQPSAQEPIVLRLGAGQRESVAFEVRTGYRRLLINVNLYDYTAHLQEDLFPGE